MFAHLKAEEFLNQASIQKTLRFGLEPIGRTDENIRIAGVLEKDKEIAKAYKIAKIVFDRIHKDYINDVLKSIRLDSSLLAEYYGVYIKHDKSVNDKKKLHKKEQELCENISGNFIKKQIDEITKKDILEIALERKDVTDEEKNSLMCFDKFFTYFTNYNTARKNIYDSKGKSNSITHRIIIENLPAFIDNTVAFKKIIKSDIDLPIDIIKNDFKSEWSNDIADCFTLDYFNFVLTQKGIDAYNTIICGDTGKTKRKGLNGYINEFNQKSNVKLPKLKTLKKQILSEKEKKTFIPEEFESDEEVLNAINQFCEYEEDNFCSLIMGDHCILTQLSELFENISSYNLSMVLIINDNEFISNLSKKVYGKWSVINDCRTAEYDENLKIIKAKSKNFESYQKNLKKQLAADKALSIAYIQEVVYKYSSIENVSKTAITDYYANEVNRLSLDIQNTYKQYCEKVTLYNNTKRLADDCDLVDLLKTFLDTTKNLQWLIKPIVCLDTEVSKDDLFYSELNDLYNRLDDITALYNKVRNYITKKPYSTDKIQLNFSSDTLLSGWDKNKEKANKAIILLKDGLYFIGIYNSQDMPNVDEHIYEKNTGNCYKKIKYKYFPDFSKMLPKCSTQMQEVKKHFADNDSDYELCSNKFVESLTISKKIFELNNVLYDNKKKFQVEYLKNSNDKQGYDDAVSCWINFCMRFLKSYKSTANYNYTNFENLDKYKDYASFLDDINKVLYQINYEYISESYVNKLVDEGQLYLFQLAGKDFSPKTKGKPNLNTMYWNMIFDENNLKDIVFKLNGGAHIYFRDKTNGEKIIHKQGSMLVNKSYLDEDKIRHYIPAEIYENIYKYVNKKCDSLSIAAKQVYEVAIKDKNFIHKAHYDIEKDRRYYHRQYLFHCPITINYKAQKDIDDLKLNAKVNRYIHDNDVYVIGIDRGERNLIYATVVSSNGKIIEQKSFNIINNVDYYKILDDKQHIRDEQRKNWKSISNIKDFKSGYLSIVVHEITQMIYKYNAIVVLEDLNCGFKNGRKKVEKQVYQNFEKALIDKLNYFVVDKTLKPEECGSVLHGLQLTHKIPSLSELKNQCGFVFYIPAWNTSKIDPATGFVNLFDTRYVSAEKTAEFLSKFDNIVYNEKTDEFEFSFDYSNFDGRAKQDCQNKWTISTHGDRIKTVRNTDKNSNYESVIYSPTNEMKKLLSDNSIDFMSDNLKSQIITASKSKEFAVKILEILRMTLQMRNSVINSVNPAEDYIISPVVTDKKPYDSRDYLLYENPNLPIDADANGAYNIARKGLWLVEKLKNATDEELNKEDFVDKSKMTNKQWLEFTQKEWADKYGSTADNI